MGVMLAILSIAVSWCLILLVVGNLWMIAFHLSRRKQMIERERVAVRAPFPRGQSYPSVCVQLPVRNEEKVIRDTVRSLCSMDWPRDRLEIMVLDDNSTDDTAEVARDEAAIWVARGLRVTVISRSDRVTKGGTLREALDLTKADFFAIFDADYRPPTSFLTETMAVLLAEPDVAFAQARIDFVNRSASWTTRAQAIELETYYAFDQATRNWAGIPTAYNGTCGVWRREAIEAAGGWTARSYLEDVDLSFRAFDHGWQGRFLTSLSVPGELPQTVSALSTQRSRWKIGWHQQFEVLPWALFRKLKWHQTLLFLLSFAFDTLAQLLVAINALLAVISLVLPSPHGMHSPAIWFIVALGSIVLTRSIASLLAISHCQRPITLETFADLARMWIMQLLLIPVACRVAFNILMGITERFEQTPKTGAGRTS
jgi:cellulose synthase/poly-beta-1,6-N-acetylglucosamine synthase-like glycosyltransferase